MKILLVGSNKSWAIETNFKKHLVNYAEVDEFCAHDMFLDYYTQSTFHKVIYRLGWSAVLKTINRNLISYVVNSQPDVLWIFKGMEIFPSTLEKIKSLGVKLANYNADDPFEYTFKGSGNKNVKNSLSLYDHHFSYSRRIVDRFQNEFKLESSWLPFAYNIAKLPKNKIEYTDVVCFIGNPDEERAKLIQYLGQNEIKIHLYGANWQKFIRNKRNITIFKSVVNENFIDTAQKYYCQLNIFRPQNINSHNMRTFEMPALGCVMFAPRSKEHLLFFEENKESFFYSTKEELLAKFNLFFELNENEKKYISGRAYKRSIEEKYSYADRSETVIQVFKKLIKSEK